MNSKTVLPGQLGLGNTESGFKTIESEAVAKVLREDWESKILENATNVGIINKHQNFVGMPPGLVAAYMSNITANTKHMTKCELQAYLKVLEALKVGYTARFPELATCCCSA